MRRLDGPRCAGAPGFVLGGLSRHKPGRGRKALIGAAAVRSLIGMNAAPRKRKTQTAIRICGAIQVGHDGHDVIETVNKRHARPLPDHL